MARRDQDVELLVVGVRVLHRELFAVAVSTSGTFAAGPRRKLFDFPEAVVFTDDTTTAGDFARDGRFLVPRGTSTEPMGDHLIVVLNWFAKLKEAG